MNRSSLCRVPLEPDKERSLGQAVQVLVRVVDRGGAQGGKVGAVGDKGQGVGGAVEGAPALSGRERVEEEMEEGWPDEAGERD